MKQAIAQSMNGVEIRNIAAIQIVQCFARGSCNEGEHGNFGQTEKPQNKILVTYTVEVTGALASESALFDQLVLCTKDAVFDDTLHKIARLSAAVDLYQVASGPSVLVKATSSRPRRQLRADLTPEDHVLFSLPAGESTMSSPFQRAHEAASVDIQNVIVVALFALASFFVHAALLNKKSDAPAEGLRQQYTV